MSPPWQVYNVYMYMILMAFLPFILLSILNALIVTKVQPTLLSAQHVLA